MNPYTRPSLASLAPCSCFRVHITIFLPKMYHYPISLAAFLSPHVRERISEESQQIDSSKGVKFSWITGAVLCEFEAKEKAYHHHPWLLPSKALLHV